MPYFFISSVFTVPLGAAVKKNVVETTRLALAFSDGSAMETVALLVMMVMPNLLQQAPHSSRSHQDRVKCLERRMDLWKDGKLEELFQEGQFIQKLLAHRPKTHHANLDDDDDDDENIARCFSRNMHQGKEEAALRLLSPSTRDNVLPLDEMISGTDRWISIIGP